MGITDWDNVKSMGFFYGWDWSVAFGTSFLSFMVGYRLLVISLCGALATMVAASAEVAVVYFADVYALERTELVAADTLSLGALLLVVLAFNLSQMELQQARTKTLQGMASQLDRIDAGMKHLANRPAKVERTSSQLNKINE